MKQLLVSLKSLVLATLVLTMTGITTLAFADEIILGYKDVNDVKQTLVIDADSSDEDLVLAASLIETSNLTVTSNFTGASASLAELAAAIASKASSPTSAILIGNAVAASNPTEAIPIMCAVYVIIERPDPTCPFADIVPSYNVPIGSGGGTSTDAPSVYIPVSSPN